MSALFPDERRTGRTYSPCAGNPCILELIGVECRVELVSVGVSIDEIAVNRANFDVVALYVVQNVLFRATGREGCFFAARPFGLSRNCAAYPRLCAYEALGGGSGSRYRVSFCGLSYMCIGPFFMA